MDTTNLKEITTSVYTFSDLIKNHCLYVDKTAYIYKLLKVTKGQFFCARPRRFGKSLTISTLEAVFRGRRELFDGLYLGSADYDWQVHPVIHIDFTQCVMDTMPQLQKSLCYQLEEIAKSYGLKLTDDDPALLFNKLIRALYDKTDTEVVLLIDEYDKPVFEHLDNAKDAELYRNFLSSFYQIIKGAEPILRFTFLTGVTKIAKLSVFSKLNHLTDITMRPEFACMFGYTQQELEANFSAWLDAAVKDGVHAVLSKDGLLNRTELLTEIKLWYDGFRFSENAETVYNPISIGKFFLNHHTFKNFWFETGTPTFLVNLLKRNCLTVPDIDGTLLSESYLDTFDIAELAGTQVEDERILDLLFQTGYLTVDQLAATLPERLFKMRFPNHEVAYSFARELLSAYTAPRRPTKYLYELLSAAESGRTEDMVDVWKDFFAGLPYDIQIKAEKYYQSIIYTICRLCGMDILTEVATNKGRIDAVLDAGKHLYIMEFKLHKTADAALAQISEKAYAKKYLRPAREKARSSMPSASTSAMRRRNGRLRSGKKRSFPESPLSITRSDRPHTQKTASFNTEERCFGRAMIFYFWCVREFG